MDGLVAHVIDVEERTDDVRIKHMSPFSKMLLSNSVRKGLQKAGFVYPSDIQAAAIPFGKSGLDLMVQSKSGTGKTLIFGTILLEAYSSNIRKPQSLVVVPAREIAVQIEGVLNHLGRFCQDFRAVSVIGGLHVVDDRKRLDKAKAVVGTPGRLLHLIKNEMLNTSAIHLLVLDEADKLYTSSFRSDVHLIQCALPSQRQTIACSATFGNNLVKKLAKIMRNPLLISTEQRASLLVGIKQFAYELDEYKTSILEMNAKLNAVKYIFGCIVFKQCMIFAGSQSRADSYCNYLVYQGWPCELISGAQDQKTRLEKFQKFREFKTRILISTDLMSRGIDSEHVNLVINLELPTDTATYLHRIGRAGRFGSKGIAINLIASEKDRELFKRLISHVGNGMQVLKFPTQGHDPKRDFWDFSDFSADCEHYGCFGSHQTAPLASQEEVSYDDSEANKENQMNNKMHDSNSSIDTNTFQVNSTGINMLDGLMVDLSEHATASGQQLTVDSRKSSSQLQPSSNTTDDASSIAADSVDNNQQEAWHQSILMQKIAIPILVEFLTDQRSEKGVIDAKNMAKKRIDLFEDYQRTVQQEEETESSVPEANLNVDVAMLKSLLIDQSTSLKRSSASTKIDVFSDYANFDGDETSSRASLPTGTTGSIDKATFLLSAATPTQAHDSIEELQTTSRNSNEICSMSDAQSLPEEKHFSSPVDNQSIPDVVSPPPQWRKMLTQLAEAQTMMVNVGAQLSAVAVADSINAPAARQALAINDDHLSNGPSISNPSTSGSESNSNTARGVSGGLDERASSSTSSGIHIHEVKNVDYEEDEDVSREAEEEQNNEEEDYGEEDYEEEDYEEEDYEEEDYGEEEEDYEEEDYVRGSSTVNSESTLVESEDYEEYDADEEDENYSEEYEEDDEDDEEENYFENEYTDENSIKASLLNSHTQHFALNAENQSQNLNPSVANSTDKARRVYEVARAAAEATTASVFENEKSNKQTENQQKCSKTSPQLDAAAAVGNDVSYKEAYEKWMEIYWKQVKAIENYVRYSIYLRSQQQQ